MFIGVVDCLQFIVAELCRGARRVFKDNSVIAEICSSEFIVVLSHARSEFSKLVYWAWQKTEECLMIDLKRYTSIGLLIWERFVGVLLEIL